MNRRHAFRHVTIAAGAVGALLAMAACSTSGTAQLTIHPLAHPTKAITVDKNSICTKVSKCYGIFIQGAPDNVAPIIDKTKPKSVVSETGKQPNVVLFYQSWGPEAATGKTNFDMTGAQNACAAGMIPMMTWESWDSSDTNTSEGVAYDQPKYSLQTIINGTYDAYIRQTAVAVKKLSCPIAIRLDQEQNGYWYPWGVTNTGMTGTAQPTPARYVAMWRHVWKIFHNQGATNVIWTWSPNHQGIPKDPSSPKVLSASYPGTKYVDWVALDGYFNAPNATFAQVFDTTIQQLRPYASDKPLLVGETGVGGGGMTAAEKASQITNLLNAVASRKPFVGMIYFDQQLGNHASSQKLFANWKFDETAESLQAFKTGIDRSIFGAGVPGSYSKN
jgi:mannan endo-1,4-beta-mannosidase